MVSLEIITAQAYSPAKLGGELYSDPPIWMTPKSGERKSEMISETRDINFN